MTEELPETKGWLASIKGWAASAFAWLASWVAEYPKTALAVMLALAVAALL